MVHVGVHVMRDEVTPRQWELICLLALGYEMQQIGYRVGRTHNAIRLAFRKVYRRTGTANCMELMYRWAWERKLGHVV